MKLRASSSSAKLTLTLPGEPENDSQDLKRRVGQDLDTHKADNRTARRVAMAAPARTIQASKTGNRLVLTEL